MAGLTFGTTQHAGEGPVRSVDVHPVAVVVDHIDVVFAVDAHTPWAGQPAGFTAKPSPCRHQETVGRVDTQFGPSVFNHVDRTVRAHGHIGGIGEAFGIARSTEPPGLEMVPVRVEGGATISIPNSVAIIRGTNKLESAQRLVDFLLSEEIELELSRSTARQIPLGPVDESELSAEVRQLKEWAREGYDFNALAGARKACLDWLMSEYLQ